MATILSQVGWRVTLLAGGYKTYRRAVTHRLYDETAPLNLILLDGGTGSAKTEILGRLAARGVQTLDLEGLAAHRGSLFGAIPGVDQPPQKLFESRLLQALDALDPARPIVVEAESSKIGERMTPPLLWRAMQSAPRIEIWAPLEVRAAYLVSAYPEISASPDMLAAIVARLPVHPGRKRIDEWRNLADVGGFVDLAQTLLEHHYDPAYLRSARRDERPRLERLELADLSASSQEVCADQIARLVEPACGGRSAA